MLTLFPYFLFTAFSIFGGHSPENHPHPPNIIVILADDAGYADFGFMGSPDLPTPRIDELAHSGVICTDAHVSASVCAPSRAGLITGRYQQRFGSECNGTGDGLGVDPSETTLADALKRQGYKTAAVGKWHMGAGPAYHPNQRGFDEFWGFLGGSRSYFSTDNPTDPNSPRAILHNSQQAEFEGYLTDALGDAAVGFIEQFKESPFFIYLAFNAPHTPMHAKVEDLARFDGHERQVRAAMTWSLDENVGKVLDKLEEEGLRENTLIFFLSDNGGAWFNDSDMGPLKGAKGNKFEGGHRVAFAASWPHVLPAGATYTGMISSLDIFATAKSVAGSTSQPDKPLDGVNIIPYLSGGNTSDPHEFLFWRKHKMAAVRYGDQKLIRLDSFGYRLYDLENNLGETIDLSQADPETADKLLKVLSNWEEGLIAPLWTEGEGWQKVTWEIHRALMSNEEPNFYSPGEMKAYLEGLKP